MSARMHIAAVKIVQQLDDGAPIRYEDTEITGGLDFTAVNTPGALDDTRSLRPPMTFINCVFTGQVRAYDDDKEALVQFEAKMCFRDCAFKETVDFRQVAFLGEAAFENACFEQEVTFEEAVFSGKADFRGAQFSQRADFGTTQFLRGGDFEGAQFSGEAWFGAAQFLHAANFEGVVFLDPACFYGTQFADGLFGSAAFEEHADFDGAQFSGDAVFEATQFLTSSGFGEAVFDGIIDLSLAAFEQMPVLWETEFKGEIYFEGASCAGEPFNPLEPG